MLIRKFYAILLLLFIPLRLNGTTVVVIVTQDGIVFSTDSKTNLRNSDYSVYGVINQSKFAIIQNRIVIAAVGTADYKDGFLHYNFLAWMEGLKLRLPDDVSVGEFTDAVERESSDTFSKLGITSALRTGTLQNNIAAKPSEIFAQFVIAGYQKGVPVLYKVEFDIDWNSKSLVGPYKVLLNPDDPTHYRVVWFGTQEAIVDFQNRDSYAYQQAVILSPKAIADISASRYPPFDETVSLSRALVQVEKNTNPDEVGGEIRTVSVLPGGVTQENTTNTETLPKGGTTSNQPQK